MKRSPRVRRLRTWCVRRPESSQDHEADRGAAWRAERFTRDRGPSCGSQRCCARAERLGDSKLPSPRPTRPDRPGYPDANSSARGPARTGRGMWSRPTRRIAGGTTLVAPTMCYRPQGLGSPYLTSRDASPSPSGVPGAGFCSTDDTVRVATAEPGACGTYDSEDDTGPLGSFLRFLEVSAPDVRHQHEGARCRSRCWGGGRGVGADVVVVGSAGGSVAWWSLMVSSLSFSDASRRRLRAVMLLGVARRKRSSSSPLRRFLTTTAPAVRAVTTVFVS